MLSLHQRDRTETGDKEHQDACNKEMTERSAVVDRAWGNHHTINWKETSVVDHEGKETKGAIAERGPAHQDDLY